MVAAGHKELHIIAQQAHWFTSGRVGAALISGTSTLICLFQVFLRLSRVFADANRANVLPAQQEFTYCRYKDNIAIMHMCFCIYYPNQQEENTTTQNDMIHLQPSFM